MNEITPALDDSRTTLTTIAETPSAADHDVPATADAAPRIYRALTERPADLESLFVPPRRQANDVTL